MDERGWKVSSEPQIQIRDYLNKRTGQLQQVPTGISPGFQHNVGKLSQRIEARKLLLDKVQTWLAMAGATLKTHASDFNNDIFKDFLAHARPGYQTYWPMAALLPKRAKQLGYLGKPQYIDLSPDTVASHRNRFTNFKLEDWARVQRIVDEGESILRSSTHRILWLDDESKYWSIVIKSTTKPGEILLTSYHKTNQKQITRWLDRHK